MANTKYVGNDGLLEFGLKFLEKLKTLFGYTSGSTLMTPEDKEKLDSIDTGATAVTIDSALSSTSTNPVQNKVINSALAGKVNTESGKGLSTNDFTTAEKNKLAGIASGATAVTVDSALSTTSTNPVQNKVINSALAGKVDTVSGKGLSTNDYTTADKNKLSGIANGAQANVIESVKVNGTALTITSKAVDVTVPTQLSELTNDAGYITSTDIPEGAAASTTSPLMDGTAAVGTEMAFARGDHRHPTDTSRQAAITSTNKLSADLISDGTTNKAYTATEKTKLAGIASGAEANVVKSVDTTASNGINLSTDSNGKLDVTVSTGTISNGNTNLVTGGTVYSTTNALAPKASPTFTGTPKAPTATAGTNDTQIATTAFANTAAANAAASAVSALGDVLVYKGTKAAYANLPTTGNKTGDVWNVTAAYGDVPAGTNWAWNGSAWDALGGSFSVDAYMTNSEVDTLVDNIFA